MRDDELLAAMWRAFQAAEHVGHPDGPMAAILAVVRAHDRDGERWRFWCAHSYLFGVLLPFRGPDDMNAQIDAAIARGKE